MPQNALPPIPARLPVVATTNLVLFPFMMAPLVVGREASLKALDTALAGDRLLAFTLQIDENLDTPTPEQMHVIGCAGTIVRMMRLPDGTAQVIVQGLTRVRLSEFENEGNVLSALVETLPDADIETPQIQAQMASLLRDFGRIVELSPILPEEANGAAQAQDEPGKLADFVASALNLEANARQEILSQLDVPSRLTQVAELAAGEITVLELTNQIQSETRKELDKGQREFILRQQLREIQKQLGEDDGGEAELEELRRQIDEAKLPEAALKAANRELDKLRRISQQSPEYSTTRNYLDTLLGVPWSVETEDNLDTLGAARILDDEHFGLEEVKERVLEYLAVRRLKSDNKGPILCFVGPPGVGKTSMAHSIAHALGRKYVRMALGGVRDEAEIRGHRRTYVGAQPGRIVQGLRDAGTNNPVMILDEIDKLGSDYRGDPTSALLEVLDPQQNNSFRDHYLEVPIDLSKVMFVTTANVLDTIPGPLRDRMEIVRIPGYTESEKVSIARRYLLPRQKRENGLVDEDFTLVDETLGALVRGYTREAGVRDLERQLGKICRKIARTISDDAAKIKPKKRKKTVDETRAPAKMKVSTKDLETYLGPNRFEPEMGNRESQIGVATGMAWTPMGGEILFIETAKMPGRGLTTTGQLGDVMKESAQIAYDYLKSNAKELGLPENGGEYAIHVHVPTGAIPKDGPSAGVAMTCALASLISNRPARHDIALTGEVTLTGRVLPVGGVKEKVLAARQAGIKTIILPERNRADLRDIPDDAKAELTFEFVSDVRDAMKHILLPKVESNGHLDGAAPDVTTPLEQDSEVLVA